MPHTQGVSELAAPRISHLFTLRHAPALLRLVLLYAALCGLLLVAGLQRRSDAAADFRLLPSPTPAVTGLPFAGVTVNLEAYTAAERPAALAALSEAGFGFVRQRFDWGQIEPQPGVYAWETADAWLDAIIAAGLVPLVVLDGSPAWARAAQDRPPHDNPLAPPADPADLARFAGAFAARYGDRVRFYQVWDEPNIAPHWGNRLIEPVAYAQLLKTTAAAIRAADADAVIAAAALAPTTDRGHTAIDEVYFWQRMVAAGAADAFDAVAIQPFGFGHAPLVGAQPSPSAARRTFQVLSFERAVLLRRALVDMGLGDKAVWAVRSGWNRLPNALWGTVTPQDQAAYAVTAYQSAWESWPWLEALGWAIDRPAAPQDDPIWGFALYEPDGAPAPVLPTLREFLAAHDQARPQMDSAQSARLFVRLLPWLLIAGGLMLVVWRSVAAARLLPWEEWIIGWRRLSWPLQALAWVGLVWLYHIAVWPPLIGLALILGALLCLTQPRLGLALAAALLPFYYQHKELPLVDITWNFPPANAALLCLLPALLVEWRRSRRQPAAIDVTVVALLGISLLSVVRDWQWQTSGRELVDLVLAPLGLWLAIRILYGSRSSLTPSPAHPLTRSLYFIALALFSGGVLTAIWGLAAWLGGEGVPVDGVLRLVGPHFSPNHTALYLLRTFFLGCGLAAAGMWTAARGRANWTDGDSPPHPLTPSPPHLFALPLWFATAVVLLALVLTGSRGALLLGLPVGALVLTAVALRRQPGLLRWLATHPTARWVVAACLLTAAVVTLLWWDRLLNRQTLSLRIDLWEASLRLWRDHLLLGVGPGGFFWSYPAYLPLGEVGEPNQLHPHNVWLETATTWGLLGLAWLGLLVWQAAAVWQQPRRQPATAAWLSTGLLAALLAAFAHAQMDAFFLLPDLAGWNLLALGILVCVREEGERVRG